MPTLPIGIYRPAIQRDPEAVRRLREVYRSIIYRAVTDAKRRDLERYQAEIFMTNRPNK